MNIRSKLLVYFLTLSLIPFIIIGLIAWWNSSNALRENAFNHLESIREAKKAQVEDFFQEKLINMASLLDIVSAFRENTISKLQTTQENKTEQLEWYFSERISDISSLAENQLTIEALHDFTKAFQEYGLQSAEWKATKQAYSQYLNQYRAYYGYYDVLFIANNGDIVFSTLGGSEQGTNLLTDNLKNTPFAKQFKRALRRTMVFDFTQYPPAQNRQIAFLTVPLNYQDKTKGVLAFALDAGLINEIVHRREGMGKTGETYLVGRNEDTVTYRSDRLLKERGQAVIGANTAHPDFDKALDGETGISMQTDASGKLVLRAYTPLELPRLEWAMITEIDLNESITPMLPNADMDFFSAYVKRYGYYDLLLIHPKGQIFYAVKHTERIGENIFVDGVESSLLENAVNQAKESLNFTLTDYAPYPPANNIPSAFIVQPILNQKQEVEMIVALHLDDSAMNAIMQQTAGMGEKSEAYLIGNDHLMRSNSLLYPETHSIRASFSNPIQGKVDTPMSDAALAGQSGYMLERNYHGDAVLASYTPIDTGLTNWALIVEIFESEAFKSIYTLQIWLGISAFILIFAILILVIRFTHRLVEPLQFINEHLRNLAQGRLLKEHIPYQSKDEIGEIVSSTEKVKQGIAGTIEQAKAVAIGNYSNEVHLLSDQDELGQALAEMTKRLRRVTEQNTTQDWLKTGQAKLNDQIRGEQDIVSLSEKILISLAEYLDASIGLLYLVQQDEQHVMHLKLMASYAYVHRKGLNNDFKLGEGLVGQAALEKKTISLSQIPDNYIHIHSGVGDAVPNHVVAVPFLYENELKGVIELATFREFSKLQTDFLNQVMPNISIAIMSAESRTQMRDLLAQSQVQAKELEARAVELQAQKAEMQEANEKLITQSEELQSQSEELQAQQEELRETNELLENRTHSLETQQTEVERKNKDLEKASAAIKIKAEELELASKYKSEFLANMSHELRTPLNSLLILAELLAQNKEGNLSQKQQEYADTIHHAGADLLTLINDILDLSKVEAGKIDVNPEEVYINQITESIERKFAHMAQNKDFDFKIQLDDQLPVSIYTDFQRLTQIMNNLLGNAFKFTEHGEVCLHITRPSNQYIAPESLQTQACICFIVRDTGIGIPEDKQRHIFEAFQQADGTTSRRFGGTGLGLSISRELVQLLGGEMALRSQVNQGSEFIMYLPERLEYEAPTVQPARTPSLPSITPSKPAAISTPIESAPDIKMIDDRDNIHLNDKTILIVEDDVSFASTLLDLSREKGFKCLYAGDGEQGLQLAMHYQPSAIMLDIGLPKIDGWSVMEQLKNNLETRHIPVHFLSGADHSHDASMMGAIGYSTKPVSMNQLVDTFNHLNHFIDADIRHILLLTNDDAQKQHLSEFLQIDNVELLLAETEMQAKKLLRTYQVNCFILDIDVLDSMDLLKNFVKENDQVPIIAYGNKQLSAEDSAFLHRHASDWIIKEAYSPERLLEEATLFLHKMTADLSDEHKKILHQMHNKNAIFKEKKVLIVDDDMRNIFALGAMLESKDMQVLTATTGQAGLDLLKQNPDTQVILMDIMMPEMDGYETIKAIRAEYQFKHTPIIALTAKAMKGDKAKCIDAGASDYLAKPVEAERLFSLLRVWLYQ